MATCLDNIISFRGKCDDTTPTSGLWTDQIGLHKGEMEKYVQFPYANVDDFFLDQLNNTVDEIKSTIYQHYLPIYKANSIIDNSRVGYTVDNMALKTGSANKYRGIEYEIASHNSPIEFFLSEFSLFVDTTATITVKVYDLNQNLMIDSFMVDAIANKITTVYPARTYQTNRRKLNLAFVYDTTLYDSIETRINSSGCSGCNKGSAYTWLNNFATARAVEIDGADDFLLENIENIDHTAGMSMVYSINCNFKDWFCSAANLIATPIRYKLAFNIVNYGMLSSDRQNAKVNENPEKLKERLAYYDFKYLETIKDVLKNMKPPNDPVCYQCNDRIKSVFAF